MGQALYRKYRTKTFAETVGQEHITKTLENAIQQGKISHAYLLTGPRGTGKTSIARILAHEINNLPYDDQAHLDIIEIDAASNRRIDEIRDLRDRVNTAPASAKYKVYIIDEVHMLTKEAFNALLKTLAEPPAHLVFILATTEAHTLPETIISRTQRYTFRPVPLDQVTAHLKFIAASEKITIDDDALALIAKHGEGSFRDSISLLDQSSSVAAHVTHADVERILGLAPEVHIQQLLQALSAGTSSAVVTTLSELYNLGFEPAMVARQLGDCLRQTVLDSTAADPQASLALLKQLLDVPAARSPKQLLELILLQSALPITVLATSKIMPHASQATTAQAPTLPQPVVAPSKPVTPPETKKATTPIVTTPPKATPPAPELQPNPTPDTVPDEQVAESATPQANIDISELWHHVLEDIKKQYNTLYGIARMAQPTFDGTKLTLAFKFGFHQKRMNEVKNRQIFADTATRLYGSPIEITCIVAESDTPTTPQPDVAAISNIFGGAELLP